MGKILSKQVLLKKMDGPLMHSYYKKTMILVKIFNRHARGWRCGSSFVVSVILRYVIVSTVLPSSLIRNIILTSTEN